MPQVIVLFHLKSKDWRHYWLNSSPVFSPWKSVHIACLIFCQVIFLHSNITQGCGKQDSKKSFLRSTKPILNIINLIYLDFSLFFLTNKSKKHL